MRVRSIREREQLSNFHQQPVWKWKELKKGLDEGISRDFVLLVRHLLS